MRALVVFVRFKDDFHDGSSNWPNHWPTYDEQEDPIPFTQLPDFATNYIESDPADVNAASLSLADSSLSAYFFWQSQNGSAGPHVLFGDVWPRNAQGEPEVYVPDSINVRYHNVDENGQEQESGYGYLTKEILDSLVVSPNFDIGNYDYNRDGQVDHLFMLIRHDIRISGPRGWSYLDGLFETAGAPVAELRYWSPFLQDSILVDWTFSGSQNFVKRRPARPLVVHEYGHRLFNIGGGHTYMIETNDVPLVALVEGEPTHDGQSAEGCAYNRMCGTDYSGNYDNAARTLSAWELRRMGWADRTVLAPTGGDQNGLTLAPLYSSGEVYLVPLAPGSAADTLSLENRQRGNFFDARSSYYVDPDNGTVFNGIGTTGLLATLSDGNPSGSYTQYRYDIVPPDNHYNWLTWCNGTLPGCGGVDLYTGDMHAPGTVTQITPWTRPNVSGYTYYS